MVEVKFLFLCYFFFLLQLHCFYHLSFPFPFYRLFHCFYFPCSLFLYLLYPDTFVFLFFFFLSHFISLFPTSILYFPLHTSCLPNFSSFPPPIFVLFPSQFISESTVRYPESFCTVVGSWHDTCLLCVLIVLCYLSGTDETYSHVVRSRDCEVGPAVW
jgi:hypothetical protein